MQTPFFGSESLFHSMLIDVNELIEICLLFSNWLVEIQCKSYFILCFLLKKYKCVNFETFLSLSPIGQLRRLEAITSPWLSPTVNRKLLRRQRTRRTTSLHLQLKFVIFCVDLLLSGFIFLFLVCVYVVLELTGHRGTPSDPSSGVLPLSNSLSVLFGFCREIFSWQKTAALLDIEGSHIIDCGITRAVCHR